MKRLLILAALGFTLTTVTRAQTEIPQSVSELHKWEKQTKAKADAGDADACRLLFMADNNKHIEYGMKAIDLYEQQATPEAYYHLAEIFYADAEKRDEYLQLSADQGYEPAIRQLESLEKTGNLHLPTEPMRNVLFEKGYIPKAEEAEELLNAAREYDRAGYRREAIWFYDMAYKANPEANAQATGRLQQLRTEMAEQRNEAHRQLAYEEYQRQMASAQWAALSASASNMASTLRSMQHQKQHPPRANAAPATSYQHQTQTTVSSNSNREEPSQWVKESQERARQKAEEAKQRLKKVQKEQAERKIKNMHWWYLD